MADELQADIERFVYVAADWEALSGRVAAARKEIEPGRKADGKFGALGSEIEAQHDEFIESMYDALDAGAKTTKAIGDLLRATARDFGMTDAEQAAYLRKVGKGVK